VKNSLISKLFLDPDKIATPTARAILLSGKTNSGPDEFAFFRSLKLRSGVTKTTFSDRMRDVDAWFIEYLSGDEVHEILDVGISSGITTVELCELLESRNVKYRLTGMDSDLTAFLITFGEDRSVLVDSKGHPIHFEIDGRGFGYVRGTNPKHFYDRAVLRLQSGFFLNFRLRAELASIGETRNISGTTIRKIDLVSRKVKQNPSIDLLEDSIFGEGDRRKYSVIRAANILNRSYFGEVQLADALRKLAGRLKPGGIMMVCRTNFEGQNNATVFRLDEIGDFGIIGRFGNGSEIEEIVTKRRDQDLGTFRSAAM
jgi:hypothetical protein